MTPTFARYLSGRLFLTALGTVAVLGALVQILDLLDTAEDILKMGKGVPGFAFYIAMRTPSIVPEVLPLGTLLAALFVFAPLVRSGEIVAMRAAGMRIWQILAAMLPAVMLLGLSHYAIADMVRPPAERRLAEWWSEGGRSDKPVWLKVDGMMVGIGRVRDGGRRLEDVSIFERDANARVSARTRAGSAVYDNQLWELKDAVNADWSAREITETDLKDGVWRTRLRPRDVVEAMAPDANVSAGAAYDVLVGKRLAIAQPSVYATALQRAFAEPATDLVMLLMAAPLAFAGWRNGKAGRALFLSLCGGLVFLLTDGVVATLGRAGVLQPALAAWMPACAFALLAVALLARLERGRPFAGRRA